MDGEGEVVEDAEVERLMINDEGGDEDVDAVGDGDDAVAPEPDAV